MRNLIKYFADRHLLVNILTLSVILLGVGSLLRAKRDLWPDIDFDQVTITTRYPGASPEDVELNVTNKIEKELKGVDGIDEMTSFSMENVSVIMLDLDPDASDKLKVRRDIRDGVGNVTDFPVEVTEAPQVVEATTALVTVLWVGITGDIPYRDLRLLARNLEKRIEGIDPVSKIEKTGYRAREIRVEVNQRAIDDYQIPMREIVNAIQLRNIRATGGSFESYTSDKNIVALAQFGNPSEVGDVIVRTTFEGPRITIRDLARIEDDFEPEKTRIRMNGRPVIALNVFKKESADIIRTVEAIKEVVEVERASLPEGVEILYSADSSKMVRNRLDVVGSNAIMGLILITIMLFVFLNFRTAFWVAMGIPLSIMGVAIITPLFGASINAVTLMGIILVIGLIVDDAIVIAESIYHQRELGQQRLDAAVNGTYAVMRPVLATILTTTLAFSPMFFMSGMMGKFISSIPLVVVTALAFSFLEGLFILPAHVSASLRDEQTPSGKKRRRHKQTHAWFDTIRKRFQRFMAVVLTVRYLVIAVFVAALMGAGWFAANRMQFILFPSSTAEEFYVSVDLPTGTSLEAKGNLSPTSLSLDGMPPCGETSSNRARMRTGP
jgi:multidrug efflux pump subunit AcrB